MLTTEIFAISWGKTRQRVLRYYLLFLAHSYLPEEVQLVIKGFQFSLNLYEYIPIRKISTSQSLFETFDFELTNPLLDPFGINSDGTIFNLYPFVASFLWAILFHLFFYIFKLLFQRCIGNNNCITKYIFKLTEKLMSIMTFGFYIRNILEISQFVLVSSSYELYKGNLSNSQRILSFWVSMLMIATFSILALFILYLSQSSYIIDETKHNKLGEFFSGIKQHKIFKIYTGVLLIRREVFVIILITLESINSRILIGIIWMNILIEYWFIKLF